MYGGQVRDSVIIWGDWGHSTQSSILLAQTQTWMGHVPSNSEQVYTVEVISKEKWVQIWWMTQNSYIRCCEDLYGNLPLYAMLFSLHGMIWEVIVLFLSLETGYPNWGILWFSSVPSGRCWDKIFCSYL